jgi:hypothetical protein
MVYVLAAVSTPQLLAGARCWLEDGHACLVRHSKKWPWLQHILGVDPSDCHAAVTMLRNAARSWRGACCLGLGGCEWACGQAAATLCVHIECRSLLTHSCVVSVVLLQVPRSLVCCPQSKYFQFGLCYQFVLLQTTLCVAVQICHL